MTEAGEILYETASRIIGLRDEALTRLCPELTGCTGRISIGVNNALGSLRLFPELIGLSPALSSLQVDTISDGRPELLAKLTKRNVELVLLETQPEAKGLQDHLTATPVRALGQKQTAWSVQHRRGRSQRLDCQVVFIRREKTWIGENGCPSTIHCILQSTKERPAN